MAANPETELTKIVRTRLEKVYDALFVKLSDRFTRGIPDALVCTNRNVMVEFKIFDTDRAVVTYKAMGLTGAQDHYVRAMCHRNRKSACVITGMRDGSSLALWLPVRPGREGPDFADYRLAAEKEEVYEWLAHQ